MTESSDGDRMDLVRLVQEHHAAVYRYAFRLTGRGADAEDLVQGAFAKAAESWGQLRDPSKARGWLLAIVRNEFRMLLRKQGRIEIETLSVDPADPSDPPEGETLDREELQAALAELPESFRLVLLMFYFEECSYREIAARLEIPEGTVMSRLSRAKEHLKARLLAREAAAAAPRSDPANRTVG